MDELSPLTAGLSGTAAALGALGLGRLIVEPLARRWGLSTAMRWGLAAPAFVLYVLALMLVHIATGGAILSTPLLVRGATVATAIGSGAWWARHRERERGSDRTDAIAVTVLVGVGLVVWATPVFRMLPLYATGDAQLHMGWAAQLRNGEVVPSGALTGDIPNFYPWMFHAVSAVFGHFIPGGHSFHTMAPVQVFQVTGAILALYALGREIAGRWTSGLGTALFGGLSGGVGFVLLRRLDLALDPRLGTPYLGDLAFKRSYNSAFYNLSPPFPRDLAFMLLAGALATLAVGLTRRSRPLLVVAGVLLGATGLTGGEAFILGVAAVLIICLLPGQHDRIGTGVSVLLPAFLVASLWLGPLVWNYLRLGFVNITTVGPVVLPLTAVLVSWGVVTPFAVFGTAVWADRIREHPGARVPLAVTAAALLGLGISILAPALFGGGFETLGRAHRYWPLLHFGFAMFGGLGLGSLLDRWGSRRRASAITVAVVVVALALPSPVVAGLALPDKLNVERSPIFGAVRDRPRNMFAALAPEPGLRCVLATPLYVSSLAWAYTGYRMVSYRWAAARPGNLARIRWKRIYEQITPERPRLRDNRSLISVGPTAASWRRTIERYGVDLLLMPDRPIPRSASWVLSRAPVRGPRGAAWQLVRTGDCDGTWPS